MKRSAGFTLLEILVALTLFAVVGGTLLGLFQSGLRATGIGDDYTHAALLARSKLTELQVYTSLTPGIYEGEFDDRYRWRVSLSERQGAEGDYLLRRVPVDVALTVAWGTPDDARQFVVNTVLLAETATQ